MVRAGKGKPDRAWKVQRRHGVLLGRSGRASWRSGSLCQALKTRNLTGLSYVCVCMGGGLKGPAQALGWEVGGMGTLNVDPESQIHSKEMREEGR